MKQVDEIVKKFEPFNMQVDIERIKQAAEGLVSSRSNEARQFFERMIEFEEKKIGLLKLRIEKPFIKVPEESFGPIALGRYLQAGKLYGECLIEINDLIQTSINAAPNKGKTNLLFYLCKGVYDYSQSCERKIGIISIDKKKDFRNLPINSVVLRLEDLRINLFDAPPNCDPVRWISDIGNTLMHVWGWMFASRNYFMKKVNDLYEREKKPPSLYEIYGEVKHDKESMGRQTNRQQEIQEVNLDRIETALREFGSCFATRKTFQLFEFIENGIPLVIEADVSPDSFAILFSWLLLYIYKLNKENDIRGNIGNNGGTLLVCDESYVLWDMAKMYSDSRRELGADFISLAPLYIRDFRTAIVAASQRPLSPDYMAAANIRIVGYTGDYKDMQYYANSLGNPDLIEVIPKLGVGEYLVKIGDREPALIRVPFVQTERIQDFVILERMRPYREAILEFCKEEIEEKKNEKVFRISEETKVLLRNVCEYFDATLTFRYEKLGWKTGQAQEYVREAVKSGYIEIVEESLDSQKKAKYLLPTASGLEWLRSDGKDVKDLVHVGKTSPRHALYQNVLVSRLKKLKWNVLHDHFVGSKLLDVYAEKEKKVGFEIVISPTVDVSRALSVLDHVDEYHFLCKDLVVLQSVRSLVNGPKIRFSITSDYLVSLKKAVLDYYTKNHQNNPNKSKQSDSDSNNHDQQENRSFP